MNAVFHPGWIALILVGCTAIGSAAERIIRFHSEIEIQADGGMKVAETIRVKAEGNAIRRGIYRDFPTEYRDRLGNRYSVDFDVLEVTRNGATEPFSTEKRSNGVRVYVGDADVFLAPGEYEYRIRYGTNFQIGYFSGHDELYWNVTGNGWAFPIDDASARVTLPADVGPDALGMEGYTGVQGSTETAVRTTIENGRSASIASTRRLAPREGLTLVMTWPKGVVAEPTASDRLGRLLRNNLGLLIALLALGSVTLYFVIVWLRVGKDPGPGPIFPHYQPPSRVSPASARHISRMGYDKKAFSAAVINLAVKGYVEIGETGGKYTLEQSAGSGEKISAGERAILDALFAKSSRVVLENKNHQVLGQAIRAHGRALKRENNSVHFVTNAVYLIPAVVIIVAAVFWIKVLDSFNPASIAVLVMTAVQVPVFARLLKAPTAIGRRLLDRIEGFKLYLEVAEKDELDLKHPPEKTPELFEAFLPYAFALGVEQRWSEKFAAVFARIRDQTGQDYHPAWYHGHWDHRDAGGFGVKTAALSSGLASAISSASTAPGSSSGAGGGGSSGGGGGGGGGGGW